MTINKLSYKKNNNIWLYIKKHFDEQESNKIIQIQSALLSGVKGSAAAE